MTQNLNKYISREYQAAVKITAPAAVSKSITGASWSAGVLTLSAAAHGFLVGDVVTIAGLDDPELDGSYTILERAAGTFGVALAVDPVTLTDVTGTAAFTNAKDGLVGADLTTTSGATARGKSVLVIGAEDYLIVDTIGGNVDADKWFVSDGDTVTGRNATALVDTVGDGTEGASDIRITTKGIERVTKVGSRVRSEVLVAIRDFTTKQAV